MNIKKILIMALFLLILTNIAIGVSYAASNEKISFSFGKTTETLNKDIVSINKITSLDYKGNINESYKINIKKVNQKNYKIKSVKCVYYFYNEETDDDETILIYDGKNKSSLTINLPTDYAIKSMTINYQTNSKIKKESTKFQFLIKYKIMHEYSGVGKKSKVTVKEKGYCDGTGQGVSDIKYLKLNIKTTNNKCKIKTVQLIYGNLLDKISKIRTFNVKGKTSFTKTTKVKYDTLTESLYKVKVTYY